MSESTKHDLVLARYLEAVDASDWDAIASIWKQAESDAELEALLCQVSEELAGEHGQAVTSQDLSRLREGLARPVATPALALRARPPRPFWALAVAASVLLTIFLGLWFAGRGTAAPLAVVELVQGDVVILGDDDVPVEAGMELALGQGIQTRGPASQAIVRLADEARIDLAGDSTIEGLGAKPLVLASGKLTVLAGRVEISGRKGDTLVVATGESALALADGSVQGRKSPPLSEPIAIIAEADAEVQSGRFATRNYGGLPVMVAWSAGKSARAADKSHYAREFYLRFDLSSVPAEFGSARIRLYPESVERGTARNRASLVPSDAWAESSLNWSNRPASTTLLASWTPRRGQPVEFDVTAAVRSALPDRRKLSVKVSSQDTVAAGYSSREASDAAERPQLLIDPRFSNPEQR